jgi:hypothetical protein
MDIPRWIDYPLIRLAHTLAYEAHEDNATAWKIVEAAILSIETETKVVLDRLDERKAGGHKPTHLLTLGAPLFQRLVFMHSDTIAKAEGVDEARLQTQKRMLVRYLQCLSMRALQATSRWIGLGVAQLVYSYGGKAVDDMTSAVAGNWDQGSRKDAKAKLMEYLKSRFSGLVEDGGSRRYFKPCNGQVDYVGPLKKWLDLISPWGCEHLLSSGVDPREAILSFQARYPQAPDKLELIRFHAFLEPLCFELLVRAIGEGKLPSPSQSLRLPQLVLSEGVDGPGADAADQGHDPNKHADSDPGIGDYEIGRLQSRLKLAGDRRRKASGRKFEIRVDGACGEVVEGSQTIERIKLPDHANIVEVYAKEPDGDVLMATHLLTHDSEGDLTASAGRAVVGLKYRFFFSVFVERTPSGSSAFCNVRCSRLIWLLPETVFWRYAVPLALASISVVLLALFQREARNVTAQAAQLAKLEVVARASDLRTRDLERQANELRERLSRQGATSAGRGPNVSPRQPGEGRGPIVIAPTITDVMPPLSMEAGVLGPSDTKEQSLAIDASMPSVRVHLDLGEVRPNATIDFLIADADPKIERRGLSLEGTVSQRSASVLLTPEEVKRLLNRRVRVTVTDRGHATLGSVILTLRFR